MIMNLEETLETKKLYGLYAYVDTYKDNLEMYNGHHSRKPFGDKSSLQCVDFTHRHGETETYFKGKYEETHFRINLRLPMWKTRLIIIEKLPLTLMSLKEVLMREKENIRDSKMAYGGIFNVDSDPLQTYIDNFNKRLKQKIAVAV